MAKKGTMGKKRRRFFIIGAVIVLVVILCVLSISYIVADRPAAYQQITFGHGGDQIFVDTPNGFATLDDELGQLVAVKAQVLPNAPAGTATQTSVVTPAQTATADFYVLVDSGVGLSGIDPSCPSPYTLIGHIYGQVSSGIAMQSSSVGGVRSTNNGWFSLCLQSSDRTQKDIVTVLTNNYCGGQTDGASCPSGYSQISGASFTRNSAGSCSGGVTLGSYPQLAVGISGNSAVKGTLIVCEKNMPEYSVASNCGTATTLGGVITQTNVPSSLVYFCKS